MEKETGHTLRLPGCEQTSEANPDTPPRRRLQGSSEEECSPYIVRRGHVCSQNRECVVLQRGQGMVWQTVMFLGCVAWAGEDFSLTHEGVLAGSGALQGNTGAVVKPSSQSRAMASPTH